MDIRLLGLPHESAFGVIAASEIVLSRGLLDRALEALGRESPVGYQVDAMDLIAFGDLASVQRQVERALTPQYPAGSERNETLAAESPFACMTGRSGRLDQRSDDGPETAWA